MIHERRGNKTNFYGMRNKIETISKKLLPENCTRQSMRPQTALDVLFSVMCWTTTTDKLRSAVTH